MHRWVSFFLQSSDRWIKYGDQIYVADKTLLEVSMYHLCTPPFNLRHVQTKRFDMSVFKRKKNKLR